MISTKILVDSNILIHALNLDSPKYRAARAFLNNYPHSQLFIAHQNILESIRIITHPKYPHPLSLKSAIDKLTLITKELNIISPTPGTEILTIKLIEQYHLTGNRIFDAYLVATMLANDITEIATDNVKDFKLISDIKVYNPFA